MKPLTALRGAMLATLLASAIGRLPAQSPATAPAASEPKDNDGTQVVTLSEFTVTATQDAGYMATESTSGTRVATKLIDLPYSVQVLTADFIKDFQLFDLDDMAGFVGGMGPGEKNNGGGGGTRIRGFLVPYFRNGFYRSQAPDTSNIERMEVVKGPQSAIYGRVAPGGVVNFISKKPLTQFHSSLGYTVGSYDYDRVDGYVTGPLVGKKLFYRVDAAYYSFNRPTDYWYNHTTNLSGGLTYKASADTAVTLEYEHTLRVMNEYQNFTRWVDASGFTQGSVWNMPDRDLGHRLLAFNVSGADRRTTRLSNSYYLTLEHRVNPDLSLRANLAYTGRAFGRDWAGTAGNWDTRVGLPANAALLNTLNWVDKTKGVWTGSRTMNRLRIDYEQYGTQVDLTKTWRRSPISQRTLLTFDVFEDTQKQKQWALTGTALDNELRALGLTSASDLASWKRPDPFNPAVSEHPILPSFKSGLWPMTDSSTFNLYKLYYGGLLNHSVELMQGRLMLTGSVRNDWAEFKRQQPLSANPNLKETRGAVRKVTYSAGINYHVIANALVGYVSYGSSFDPAPQADPNTGAILGFKSAKGAEVGLKGALRDGTFSYTLSVYRVNEDNEVTNNPDNPTGIDPTLPRYIGGGATRGQGLSLDVSGKVTANFTLLGNIAWVDTRFTKFDSNPALIGTRPLGGQNQSVRSSGVAGRYDFRTGWLKGLHAGIRYEYYAPYLRIAETATSTAFVTPGKSEVGAFLSYDHKLTRKLKLTYSLNVTDLLDQQVITPDSFTPFGRDVKFAVRADF